MSVRASIGLPRACSGDMYCDVPRTTPASVWTRARVIASVSVSSATVLSVSFARPKSRTLTWPLRRIIMFSGLMSR